jgi:hypothetical protein
MFALSIAMAARLFVVCFDLGAQALRVQAWGWGRPIPQSLAASEVNDALISSARSLGALAIPPAAPASTHYPDILTSYYDFTAGELIRLAGSNSPHDRFRDSRPHGVTGRKHAHLH